MYMFWEEQKTKVSGFKESLWASREKTNNKANIQMKTGMGRPWHILTSAWFLNYIYYRVSNNYWVIIHE